ncbi:DUF1127 domain-containing protein [Hyphomicrobium sp.]|uniref:DUF1127 domain-containing protein n=1 Tax=Hyphomicrobium sp. TaxID=82 RepID=UPI0025C461F2|nr:DUF1127 domain-containing protein [Hyphomicrobium sp.]MCC7252450.1 DUF1127 domain-containing protein [Hyphomicrobium sp.]
MDHTSCIPHCPASRRKTAARLTQALSWAEAVFRTVRERRQLMALDERALQDIGVSRADAYEEWRRPFWDLPH